MLLIPLCYTQINSQGGKVLDTKGLILLNLVIVLIGLALTGLVSWTLFFAVLLALAFGFGLLYMYRLGRQIAQTRCPHCGQLFSSQRTGSTVLGIFNRFRASAGEPLTDGGTYKEPVEYEPHLTSVPHIKLKVHNRCKHCGYEWDAVRTEKQ